jgi:hypothetical protein
MSSSTQLDSKNEIIEKSSHLIVRADKKQFSHHFLFNRPGEGKKVLSVSGKAGRESAPQTYQIWPPQSRPSHQTFINHTQ